MAKAIYLLQIRKRMESIHNEYNALSEAYQLISSAGSTRGRKAKIPSLQDVLNSEVKVKTGRRGRPPGAKNKPGAKKPGPKPSPSKSIVLKAEKVKPASDIVEKVVKPAAKKRGRKPKAKVKSAKSPKPAAVKSAVNKPSVNDVVKAKPGKPNKPVKAKRSRIPNLAEKIQELVAKTGRFTTNSVITDKLAVLYPGKTRSDLGKYISVILSNMKARKELSVVTQDAKGNKMRSGLWGLPAWFEGTKPKLEFLK